MGGLDAVVRSRRGGSEMLDAFLLMMQRCPTAAVGRVLVSQRCPGAAEIFITLLNPVIRGDAVPSMGRHSN